VNYEDSRPQTAGLPRRQPAPPTFPWQSRPCLATTKSGFSCGHPAVPLVPEIDRCDFHLPTEWIETAIDRRQRYHELTLRCFYEVVAELPGPGS
jgi:hypothetical protein